VLIGGIVAVVVVLGLVAAAAARRRSHDDVHSVEHYHRSLHTLEEMRAHAPNGDANGAHADGDSAHPAGAFHVSGSSTVRLTESVRPVVPPAPPPPVTTPETLHFDDGGTDPVEGPEALAPTFMTGTEDRAMHGIDKRPRRLGAPAAAVGAVLVLVVVLVVTGMHTNAPTHRHHSASGASTGSTTVTHPRHRSGAARPSTTHTTIATVPPLVSAPSAVSAHAATYAVSVPSYSLVLAATNGECWVQATNTTTGAVLFSGTLSAGQSHTVAVAGPLTVIAGAPSVFAATVNGVTVALPAGTVAPFTLTLQAPAAGASST
jgi:Domain of unknown function (DUF4115)